nr:hypothetical protein [Tanacetum cinerariifolium]
MESFSGTVILSSSTQVKIEANEQTPHTNGDPCWLSDVTRYFLFHYMITINCQRNNTEASSDRVAPEDYVAIDIKEDKVETPPAASAADPQRALYSLIMYFVTITATLLSSLAPKIIYNKSQSPFDAHAGLIMVMAIVSAFTALLASAILVFANFLLQSWMKNIYYNVLKSVGVLFGLLALYFEILVIFLPRNLNLRKKGVGTQRESLTCCGQFVTRIAKRLGKLSDEVLNGLSAPTYYRPLDANALRELIGSNGRLIPEEFAPSIPIMTTLRAPRRTTYDLYDKIGQLESRLGEIERMTCRQSYHSDRYARVLEHIAAHYGLTLRDPYDPPSYFEQEQ